MRITSLLKTVITTVIGIVLCCGILGCPPIALATETTQSATSSSVLPSESSATQQSDKKNNQSVESEAASSAKKKTEKKKDEGLQGSAESSEQYNQEIINNVDIKNARSTTTAELLSAPKNLDGMLVTFTGEVIGDCIDGSASRKWILLSEDGNALSVLMPDHFAEQIEYYGKYGVEGTKLKVYGVYRIADPSQAGELYVLVSHVEVVSPGGPREMPTQTWKLVTGIVLFVLAGILGLLYRYLKRRSV